MRLRTVIIDRFRADLRLALIALFGALSSATIAPFGVFRALQGQWVMALVDLSMVALVIAGFVYAWRRQRSLQVGNVLVVVITLAAAVAVTSIGLTGLLWAYTVLVASFMLGSRWLALACNVAIIAVALAQPRLFPTTSMALAFVITALLVSLYSMVFAWMTEFQRGQLQQLASRDPLTDLPNRRTMEAELAAAVASHHRRGRPAALAMLDLDEFKQVNDIHGHEAGDQVLVALAETVSGSIRKSDRLFRFGGEEFVLLLPCTDVGGATCALEKVLTQIRTMNAPIRVRSSIGATMLRADDDWSDWLARADAALFHAKRSGRDRISFDEVVGTVERRGAATPEPVR